MRAGGAVETVETQYFAACDGGRSAIRHQLGIEYSGTAGLVSSVSIYFRVPGMIDRHPFGHGNIFFPMHRDQRGFMLTWKFSRIIDKHPR